MARSSRAEHPDDLAANGGDCDRILFARCPDETEAPRPADREAGECQLKGYYRWMRSPSAAWAVCYAYSCLSWWGCRSMRNRPHHLRIGQTPSMGFMSAFRRRTTAKAIPWRAGGPARRVMPGRERAWTFALRRG